MRRRFEHSLRVTYHKTVRFVTRLLVWPVLALWPRRSSRSDVLLICHCGLMAEFLRDVMAVFKGDPNLCFKVLFCYSPQSNEDRQRMHDLLPIPQVSRFWAYAKAWDLVITADHFSDLLVDTERVPVIFCPHGAKAKCLTGEETEYSYGTHAFDARGRLRYRLMFEERESERDSAIDANPVFKDVIVVVGSLVNDKLLTQAKQRDGMRDKLGLAPDDIAVFVISTWGAHSLLHVMGDELLSEMRALGGGFRFMLSAHPHEYRPRPEGQRVWGEYLREQRQYGFIVREPSESWMSYLIASDVVISDYTSLIQPAALLEKPIILTPVPEERIWTGSVNWQVRQFAPMLSDAKQLPKVLADLQAKYPMAELHRLAQTIAPHAGEAEERIRRAVYGLLGRTATPTDPKKLGCGENAFEKVG